MSVLQLMPHDNQLWSCQWALSMRRNSKCSIASFSASCLLRAVNVSFASSPGLSSCCIAWESTEAFALLLLSHSAATAAAAKSANSVVSAVSASLGG